MILIFLGVIILFVSLFYWIRLLFQLKEAIKERKEYNKFKKNIRIEIDKILTNNS